MMRWLRYLAVVFVILQTYNVRGEFGLSFSVSGANTVALYAGRIRDEASGIASASGDITLDGPSVAFNEAAAALRTMFDQIVQFLQPIAQSIAKLALDRAGPVEAVFGDADTKINAMLLFITGSAQTQLATIQTKVSGYVRSELNNILNAIKTELGALRTALSSLRSGVIAARDNKANSTTVQNYVKPSMVSLVQSKMLMLTATLPAAAFSAIESARTINQANIVILTGNTIASGTELSDLWESELLKDYEKIGTFLQSVKALVTSEVPLVNGQIGQFGQPYTSLTSALTAKYSEIDSVFGRVTGGIGDNVLNGYKTLVSYATGYAKSFVEKFYPPIEPVMKRLAEILVQRGNYSDFCFETYYPRVEQYLFSGQLTVVMCMNTELDREKVLVEALAEINYQLKFFLEDANAYLKTCTRISKFDTDLATQCLQEHKDFSELIPCTTTKEYATLLQLLCKEVDSILLRLWSCISRDSMRFPLEAKDILAKVETCKMFGPTP